MSKEKNIMTARIVQSYLSSVISISLVLLLVGLVSVLAVNARAVSDYFKENIRVTAVLEDGADELTASKLMATLKSRPYVSDMEYISKEQGTEEMKAMLGENFMSVFDVNPVPVSIEIFLKAGYFHADSLKMIERELEADPQIEDLVYQESLVGIINSNMEKIGMVFVILTCMLMFISFVLINNTVRLNVYSKRFTVHTMRMVGATKAFIRAPFLYKAILQGLIAGLLAVIYMVLLMYLLRNEFTQIFDVFDTERILAVFAGTVLLGMVLCLVSTYFVVNRMVDMSKNKLYI